MTPPTDPATVAAQIIKDWTMRPPKDRRITPLRDAIATALLADRQRTTEAAWEAAIKEAEAFIPDMHVEGESCSDCAMVRSIVARLRALRDGKGT